MPSVLAITYSATSMFVNDVVHYPEFWRPKLRNIRLFGKYTHHTYSVIGHKGVIVREMLNLSSKIQTFLQSNPKILVKTFELLDKKIDKKGHHTDENDEDKVHDDGIEVGEHAEYPPYHKLLRMLFGQKNT
jgi:hypothetical protein